MNGFVYAIGGYDSTKNEFLDSAEKYNIETDKWEGIKPLNEIRCAPGVAVANIDAVNKIVVCGGYDGNDRLDTIEIYDSSLQEWSLVSAKLPIPLSNLAVLSSAENRVLVLGGGNTSYYMNVTVIDLTTDETIELKQIPYGIDIRNKAIYCKGFIYIMGGKDKRCMQYSIKENKWKSVEPYPIDNNLDSFSCALAYKIK